VPRAVRLIRPLERAILSGHPWIYREALAPFEAAPGDFVDVFDKRGRLLAKGYVDGAAIAVRILTTHPKDSLGVSFLRQRFQEALAAREASPPPDTDAYRWVHGEGDRLPGVVCDRYGTFAVLKLDGEGALALFPAIAEAIEAPLIEAGVRGALWRSSRKQGDRSELLFGEPPPSEIEVREHGMRLLANLWEGQKTGLFLDHRQSRLRVRGLSRERRVLNLYGYTGGFSVAAGLGGARAVTTVDLARPAIDLAERSYVLNGLEPSTHRALAEDVPTFLKRAREQNERYELVVADPPNFAPQHANREAALESYAALHASCIQLVVPQGLYLAASCSSHIRAADFLDTLREGSRRARRVLSLLEQSGAPFDHPRLLSFPEGDYLKVCLCRVQ
jgi:23S rRNA (cytosine1962-C5)-methyltransferase